MAREFAELLDEHLRAGYQCMHCTTSEEARCETEINRVAKAQSLGVVTWDFFEGFSAPDSVRGQAKYRAPAEALRAVVADDIFKGNQLFVFRDLDDFFPDPVVRRTIKSLTEGNRLVNKKYKRPIVVISPVLKIHEKIKTCMTPIDFALPDEAKLRATFRFVKASIESGDRSKAECSQELEDQIVQCLMGLTSNEAENALARCLVRHGGFKPDMLGTIKDEKAAIIKKSEVLTYIPEQGMANRDEIGGFDLLLEFIDRRRLAYTRKARSVALDFPKGIVLLGVPGTGKSYVAKAVAKLLGLPGYIMDVGSVFGSLVGESEARMRDALRQVDAQQGCVLLLDEADKAFGGAADSQGDSGVTRRVFGQLLTWLADKNDKTFVIMTMNRTKGIPPEFLRAGRFDAVFYTDLPHEQERQQIIDIHLRKRGVPKAEMGMADPDWAQVMEKTQDFVGSELEELVREARYLAFQNRESGTPNFPEMIEAAGSIIPLAKLDDEGVKAIREFCANRAKRVTSPLKEKRATSRTRAVQLGSGN